MIGRGRYDAAYDLGEFRSSLYYNVYIIDIIH